MFRIARLQLSKVAARSISSSAVTSAAQVFRMPAMSPTMTEGGIVSWKLKAGEEFAAGDVLLEIETDKATIDVEAQDDGIMWELLEKEGVSGIPVGKPIAFLAEPGDDLSKLEKPDVSEDKKPEPKKEQPKEQPKETSAPKNDTPKKEVSKNSSGEGPLRPANREQKLLPSVELLLHQNNISEDDAYSKILASGPKGRILKGDVLAYLGLISQDAVVEVANYIHSKEHLDLSNIVLAEKKPEDTTDSPAKAESKKPAPSQNIITIQFTSELGEDISREKFQYAFEKSINGAIRQTYAKRFPEYSSSPIASPLIQDDIFNDLTSPSVTQSRFEVYGVKYNFQNLQKVSQVVSDLFDELLGLTAPVSPNSGAAGSVSVEFKIKINDKLSDSSKFVDLFQSSLLTQVPTKQLTVVKQG